MPESPATTRKTIWNTKNTYCAREDVIEMITVFSARGSMGVVRARTRKSLRVCKNRAEGVVMILSHKIALDLNNRQETYFRKAEGAAVIDKSGFAWAVIPCCSISSHSIKKVAQNSASGISYGARIQYVEIVFGQHFQLAANTLSSRCIPPAATNEL